MSLLWYLHNTKQCVSLINASKHEPSGALETITELAFENIYSCDYFDFFDEHELGDRKHYKMAFDEHAKSRISARSN